MAIDFKVFPWSVQYSYTPAPSNVNNIDSSGEYPRHKHWGDASINLAARGLEIQDLWGVGSTSFVSTDYNFTKPSVYPNNQVNETPHGHVLSVDDTPGNERIMVRHKSGSGVDIRPDGSIIISTRRNRMQYVTGDDTLIVDGDTTLVHNGNVRMEVAGDFDVSVGGDYNLEVMGQRNTRVRGSHFERVEKNKTETVLETKAEKTVGDQSSTVLGKRYDITKETYDQLVEGKTEFKFGDNFRVSSMKDINFASKNYETVSERMALIAPEGVVGGENTEHFGKLFSGPANAGGSGTTFVGTLAGIAAEAVTSRYAKYSEEAWATLIAKYSIVATNLSNVPVKYQGSLRPPVKPNYPMVWIGRYTENRTDFLMPTESIVSGILETTDKGIVEFRIFDRDMKKRITLEDDYNGVFTGDPTPEEARQVLFDDESPLETLLEKGIIQNEELRVVDSDS